MTKERIIIIFGIIFTLVWATKVPFLFPHPFQPQEGIKRLSQEASQFPKFIQESVGIDGLQAEEIEKNLLKEIRVNWIVSTLVISLGCFAGYLLVRRKKSGRLILKC